MLSIAQIAEICHENNRAYCHTLGDYTNPPWRFLNPEQQQGVMNGVDFNIKNPDVSPKVLHDNWWKEKVAKGWVYGPVKDATLKTHPNMVPYSDLSPQERAKDIIFSSMVNVLKGM